MKENLERGFVALPLRGEREGTILGLKPYWLHGMPHYHVYFRLDTDDEEEQPHELPLAADQLHDEPRPGDRVKFNFMMRQLQGVEFLGRDEGGGDEDGDAAGAV